MATLAKQSSGPTTDSRRIPDPCAACSIFCCVQALRVIFMNDFNLESKICNLEFLSGLEYKAGKKHGG